MSSEPVSGSVAVDGETAGALQEEDLCEVST